MNENLILLLGAGASASFGYSLSSDLSIYQEIENLPTESLYLLEEENVSKKDLKPFIEDIEHYLQRRIGQINFEAAIDRSNYYYHIVNEIKNDDSLSDVLLANQEIRVEAGLLSKRSRVLFELLYKVLLNIYGINRINPSNNDDARKLLSLLEGLQKYNIKNNPPIYTTNYDAAWENIANLSDNYYQDFIIRSAQKDSVESTFSIRRLHGCVRYCRNESGCSYLNDEEIDWKRLEFKDKLNLNLSELMIVKIGQQEPVLDEEPFRSVFSVFESDLNKNNTIFIVIGFSFRDINVSHRIFDAFQNNAIKKIICIDPLLSHDDIIERLLIAGGCSFNKSSKETLKKHISIINREISEVTIDQILKHL